jgi:hypothetical protein
MATATKDMTRAEKRAEKDEERQRKDAREAANKAAEARLEAQAEPEPADVEAMIQQLTLIYLQAQSSDKLALSTLAKALLQTLKFKLAPDATPQLLHQHGRNVVPGTKTHIPEFVEVPTEIHSTRRDRPVEQWEVDEAFARQRFAADGGDPELLRAEQAQKRQEDEQKRRDEEQQKARDRAKEKPDEPPPSNRPDAPPGQPHPEHPIVDEPGRAPEVPPGHQP